MNEIDILNFGYYTVVSGLFALSGISFYIARQIWINNIKQKNGVFE